MKLPEATILYVEDEDDIRMQMAHFLGKKVRQIHTAINGRDGLSLFHEVKPDLVITDIRMPVMEGVTMADEIRRTHPGIPIVYVTACDADSGFLRPDTCNCCTIQKPIDLRVLVRKMSELLDPV